MPPEPKDDPATDARIERTGVRAARAGQSHQSNPYLERENMPGCTGETLRQWSRKHDAWQRGFERQDGSAPRRKERLGRVALAGLVERRVRNLPVVRDALARSPAPALRLEAPYPHARDGRGRNWNVSRLESPALPAGTPEADFRAAIDELRDAFDLAGPTRLRVLMPPWRFR